jgi:hypothetical protein
VGVFDWNYLSSPPQILRCSGVHLESVCPFGCNGHVTSVAAGQSQRPYSGVGIFNWYYLSLPPQILRCSGVHLESVCPFGCNGYVTAVAAGQSQRFYPGAGIFNWYYLSSLPQILRCSGVHLESGRLTCVHWGMAVTSSRYKFVTVSLPKRFRKDRFTS